jgi:Asp-tRNA(Asn)/Glu-tRNA(Gln) amidotransferase A subunit family amidase
VGELPLDALVERLERPRRPVPQSLRARPFAFGSSSGSGRGGRGELAPLAIGSETDGSIVSPAAVCGLVGVKPTLGWISRSGVVPIATARTRRDR